MFSEISRRRQMMAVDLGLLLLGLWVWIVALVQIWPERDPGNVIALIIMPEPFSIGMADAFGNSTFALAAGIGSLAAILVLVVAFSLLQRWRRTRRLTFPAVLGLALLLWFILAIVALLTVILFLNREWMLDEVFLFLVRPSELILIAGVFFWIIDRGGKIQARAARLLLTLGALILCNTFLHIALGVDADHEWSGMAVGNWAFLALLPVGVALRIALRNAPAAFLVWPLTGAFTGLVLRAIIDTEEVAKGFLHREMGLPELVAAVLLGGAMTVIVFMLKLMLIDRTPAASRIAIRIRGILLMFHAIVPLIIVAFIVIAFHSFTKEAEDDLAHIGADFSLLADDAHHFFASVTGAEQRIEARVKQIEADVAEMFDEFVQIEGRIENEVKRDIDFAKRIVPEIAGEALASAKRQADAIVTDVTDSLKNAFKIPPIHIPLFGEFHFPDLGIGKAIGNMFHNIFKGLMPNLNLKDAFTKAVSNMTASVEAKFHAPLARLQQMEQTVLNMVEEDKVRIMAEFNGFEDDLNQLIDEVLGEKDDAYEHLKVVLVDFVSLGYHLLVFLAAVLLGVVLLLIWRTFNSLVNMGERLGSGWRMMTRGTV